MNSVEKFETTYRNAKEFAKAMGLNDLGLYRAFRTEANLNFGMDMDDTDYDVNTPEIVYNRLCKAITVKEMCRRYYAASEYTFINK